MPRDLNDQFDNRPTLFQVMAWCHAIMQEAITLICVDQDLRLYIAWSGHNKLSLKASRHQLTHNTPKHFQICYKINNSILSYKTVDI